MTSEPQANTPDSLELVRRAQRDDPEAMNRLVARYYPRLRRIVRLRLGRDLRTQVDSLDICQETFRAAVHDFGRFEVRGDASLLHWLGKLAENQIRRAAEHYGAQKRDPKREVPLDPAPADSAAGAGPREPSAAQPTPLEDVILHEEEEHAVACLAELREDYRDAITLRLEGASFAEIADCLECPSPNAARMLWTRATVRLTKLWATRRAP